MKTTQFLTWLLLLLICNGVMMACGSRQKQKSAALHERVYEERASDSLASSSAYRLGQQQGQWLHNSEHSFLAIWADSPLQVHPGGGFQLNQGKLLYSAGKETTENQKQGLEIIHEEQAVHTQSSALSSREADLEEHTEIQRKQPSKLVWLLFGAILALFVWLYFIYPKTDPFKSGK